MVSLVPSHTPGDPRIGSPPGSPTGSPTGSPARHVADGASGSAAEAAGILDRSDEHVYSAHLTAAGRYVNHSSEANREPFLGGAIPAGSEPGPFWESRIHPADRDR